MSANDISDADLNIGANPSDRIGKAYGDQIIAPPVRGVGALKSLFGRNNRTQLYFGLAAGLLVIAACLWSFLGLTEEKALGGGVGTVSTSKLSSSSNATPSQLQQDEAVRYNNEALVRLQETDPSAHPLILVSDTPAENPFQSEERVRSPKKISEVGTTENSSSSYSHGNREVPVPVNYKGMDTIISALMSAESVTPQVQKVSWKYRQPELVQSTMSASMSQVGMAAEDGVSDSSVKSKCENRPIRAGGMYMGTTDIALNSDVGGPVSVSLRNGSMRGSQLLGSFERKDKFLRLALNTLVTDEGTESISAIALDMDTTLNAVQGDVDSHILYRYGWWGLGTVLQAVGKAAESNADRQVFVSDGVVIESAKQDTSREIKLALGSLGQGIGEQMTSRLDRPITVSLKVGDEVGVFFLEDVCL